MDSKIGAFWFPKKKTGNGPIGKGSLDLSKLDKEELNRIKKAITEGQPIKVTLWENGKATAENKWPNFQLTLDKPYEGNSGDIPF